MTLRVGGILILLLALPVLADEDKPKDKPTPLAKEYEALVQEHSKAQQEFFKAYQEASDEDKK